jgi:hypothetical protein
MKKTNLLMKCLILIFLCAGYYSCKKDTPATDDSNNDGVVIDSDNAIIDQDTEWKDIHKGDTIDYYVKTLIKIQKTAILTIKPGVKIAFETAESGIRVEENAGLNASGEANKPIIFTSRNQSKGVWRGIIFASNNVSNKLDYVEVYYAGSMKDEGYCDAITAIGIAKDKNAKVNITNSKVERSAGYGLWVAGTADISLTFAKNVILDCDDAPVALTADNIAKLDSFSNYAGNGKYYIDVYSVTGPEITGDVTIQQLNVPYRISGRVHILKTLTIAPGCILEFNTGGELTTTDFSGANHTGIIKAEGKVGDSIVFRGVQSTPGSWVGLSITSQAANSFLYCKVSEGGSTNGYANPSSAKGNFVVGRIGNGATATIKHSRIFNSAASGIAKYTDTVTPSKSSVVTTTTTVLFGTPPVQIELITNKYSGNTSGNIGDYMN